MFQGPAFVAWTELWIAARTDPELAVAVTEVERRFTEESRAEFLALFPAEAGDDAMLADIARDFAFAVMTGVALQRLFPRATSGARLPRCAQHVFRLWSRGERS